MPGQEPVGIGSTASFSFLPDGSGLVYRSRQGGEISLMLRRWADLESTRVRGTAGAWGPSVSPDGREVAYLVSSPVGWSARATSLATGATRELMSGVGYAQVHWGRDGFVYVTTLEGVSRIPARGGEPTRVIRPPDGVEAIALWETLPGGRLGLGWQWGSRRVPQLVSIDLESGRARTLGPQGLVPEYLPPGYVLHWTTDSTVVATPFDPDEAELTGESVTLLRGVYDFDVSDDGTLFYWGPRPPNTTREFVWVSRSGEATAVEPGWTVELTGSNDGWSLSPDGARLAYRERRDGNRDIWIKDLDAGTLTRLTFDPGQDCMPRWTPDGERVTFLSSRGDGDLQAWSRAADGTGEAEPLFTHTRFLAQAIPSPEGWLLLRTGGAGGVAGGRDILAVRPEVDSVATPLLMGEYDEVAPSVSPDGRWLAYASEETGTWEVYVRPFPDVDAGKWPVSTGGGGQPVWGRNGRELFYVTMDGEMVAARYDGSDGYRVTGRTILFEVPAGAFQMPTAYAGKYDVTPDGQRFIMARTPPTTEELPPESWVLIQNADRMIEELVGPGGGR
jgi:serine/threonine-protein kinase